MEKTKIRRSLFIGLGGTGMRTLLYLKKLFLILTQKFRP